MKRFMSLALVGLLVGFISCRSNPEGPGVIIPVPVPDETQPGPDNPANKIPDYLTVPGFGLSKERPQGQPFKWPEGVEVVGKPTYTEECYAEAIKNRRLYGSGGLVKFCITLQNNTSGIITINLPPGLTFVSEKYVHQNGILILPALINIPKQSRIYAALELYCINQDRLATKPGDTFDSQPVMTKHPALDELIQLLANKQVNVEHYNREGGYKYFPEIAIGLWKLIKTDKLPQETRDFIQRLPNTQTTNPNQPQPDYLHVPGFGLSALQPVGEPFQWPVGITASSPTYMPSCYNDAVARKRVAGSGNLVKFCLTLSNTTSKAITVTIPAGTVWNPLSNTLQNGILLKTVQLTVPANGVFNGALTLYSINKWRAPVADRTQFDPLPVAGDHPGVNELIRLLSTKQINGGENAAVKSSDIDMIQNALWDIIIAGKTTDATMTKLKALP